MRFAAPVRAEIGIPTVFNILGPLANPARVRRQVIGVSDHTQAEKMLRVLEANGAEHVLVVTGDGPLDELALTGESNILELVDGEVRTYGITPESVGLDRVGALGGGDAAHNAILFRAMLDGAPGAVRDIVSLTAAAGLLVAGIVGDLGAGVRVAQQSIDSGAASAAHQRLLDVVASSAG
jgi:anthranilate phosphoribosyltransferase